MFRFSGIFPWDKPLMKFPAPLRFLESSYQRSTEVVFWTLMVFAGAPNAIGKMGREPRRDGIEHMGLDKIIVDFNVDD